MGTSSCPGYHIVLVFLLFWWPSQLVQWWYKATFLLAARVPLYLGGSTLHWGEDASSSILLTWRVLTHYTPQFGLAKLWPSSMSSCVGHGVHHLMTYMGKDIIPLAKCMCSFQWLCLLHITCCLHLSSVDALADVHGRSCNFPLIHPREVLLARHWVSAWPLLSCGHHHIFISFRSGLAWGGAGTSVLCMTDTYTQGNAKLWCKKKKSVLVEDAWPSTLVHHFVGGDICCDLMYHLACLLLPSIPDLPLSLKGISLH